MSGNWGSHLPYSYFGFNIYLTQSPGHRNTMVSIPDKVDFTDLRQLDWWEV
jgi:hypothetical protein